MLPTQIPETLPEGIKVIASGIDTPEGPTWGPDGALYFVSAGDGGIYRLGEDGTPARVAQTGGRPNGLAFSRDGAMYVADTGVKAILRIGGNGVVEVVAESYESKKFGGPNDLAFLPNGDLLFTDPNRVPLPDPAISPVYRVRPDGTVGVFAGDLAFPNGIEMTADRTGVFVAEMRAHRLVMYQFDENGNAMQERLVRRFHEPASPDGMAVDIEGNIFQSLPGIQSLALISADGALTELYYSPKWRPSNAAFGGLDMKTVFVTSEDDGAIYSFQHDVAGVDLLK